MRWTGTDRTAFSRRGFLAALGSLIALPVLSQSPLAAALEESSLEDGPLFASAYKSADGSFGIGLIDEFGQILARLTLPGRGHGMAVSPDRGKIVAFARRPGTFAIVTQLDRLQNVHVIASEPGRHFYGHGCFSADGRLLYTAENDYAAGRGVIGVYDMGGDVPQKIGEFDSFGVGPHDLLLGPDGKSLVVANGGIRTHPDKAREKLNLDTMSPSIAFIDPETGDLRADHRLPLDLHRLSLRHMALDGAGRVWVGGQFEGGKDVTPPLVGVFERDREPLLMSIPDKVSGVLNNYIGSVAANADGSVIATSAPRGGKTLFWKADTGTYLGHQDIPDGCGVAAIDTKSFLVSDGNGAMSYVIGATEPLEVLSRPAGISWDNHMAVLR